MPRPTSQDLAGFWDLLQLSIDDVTSKFNELQKIKSNDWRLIESPVKKVRTEFVTLHQICPERFKKTFTRSFFNLQRIVAKAPPKNHKIHYS